MPARGTTVTSEYSLSDIAYIYYINNCYDLEDLDCHFTAAYRQIDTLEEQIEKVIARFRFRNIYDTQRRNSYKIKLVNMEETRKKFKFYAEICVERMKFLQRSANKVHTSRNKIIEISI